MKACDLCDKSFPFIYELLDHKARDHYNGNPIEKTTLDDANDVTDDDDKPGDTKEENSTIETTKIPNYKELYQLRDQQARKFERLYKTKLMESKQYLSRIKLFEKQIGEFVTNFKDSTFNDFSNSIINDKSIADFLELSRLIAQKKFTKVARNNQLLQSMKTLFTGLKYGVIPLVVFQRIRLSAKERKLIKIVDNKNIEDVKKLFLKYTNEFENIFGVVEKTLLLLKDLNDDNLS